MSCLRNQLNVRLSVLASMLGLLAGCSSTAHYKVADLPREMQAPQILSSQHLDLSKLARSAPNSKMVYPGDVLEITVATGIEEQSPVWQVRVAEDGRASIPLLGVLQLAGREFSATEQAIYHECRRQGKFVNPHVSVALKSRQTNSVRVTGAVKEPNTYEIPASHSDLLTALMYAGGITDEADTVVEIRHPQSQPGGAAPYANPNGGNAQLAAFHSGGGNPNTPAGSVQVDLVSASTNPNDATDLRVADGTVVMVKKREPNTIYVMGLVQRPDQFEIPANQEVRLLDAIALAGGRTLQIADKAYIIRKTTAGERVIEASVAEAVSQPGANIRLASGDIVKIEETPLTMFVGTLQNFMRVGLTAGIPGL